MRSHVIHLHLQKHLLTAFMISGYLDISLSFIQYLIISYDIQYEHNHTKCK